MNAHRDNPPTLLDQAAVADRLGVAVTSVQRYRVADRARYGFPDPDGYLGRTPWWFEETIDAWAADRPGKGAGAGRPTRAEVERRERLAARRERAAARRARDRSASGT